MLRAIAAAKKKNDSIDAGKIADCLRCDFLPECYMASTEIGERRRTLRYRHLLVRQMVQMKNRVAGLLMETGVSHIKRRLHKIGYFSELMASSEMISENLRPLLQLSRDSMEATIFTGWIYDHLATAHGCGRVLIQISSSHRVSLRPSLLGKRDRSNPSPRFPSPSSTPRYQRILSPHLSTSLCRMLAQPEMEKRRSPLGKILPLGAGIFKAWGLSSDDCLPLVERTQPPAPLNIGSMSPATLSLDMVASLQSPLPFHMVELS